MQGSKYLDFFFCCFCRSEDNNFGDRLGPINLGSPHPNVTTVAALQISGALFGENKIQFYHMKRMLLFSFTTLLPDSLWPLLLRDIAQCGKLLLIAVVLIEFYTLQICFSDIQQILANEQIGKFVFIEVTFNF